MDEIEWFGISDHNARMNALLAGDIAMMSGLDPKAIRQIERTPGVGVVNTKAGQYTNFAMMTDRAPTDNNELRLAIKHLQNRERVLKLIYKGNGMLGNDQPISPVDPMYCDEIPTRPFDPDKAKHHLKKAGMDGATIKIHTSEVAGTGAIEQALLLQREAGEIGLDRQSAARPRRRLLERHLGEKALLYVRLEHASHHQHHADPGIHLRCRLERGALEECALR